MLKYEVIVELLETLKISNHNKTIIVFAADSQGVIHHYPRALMIISITILWAPPSSPYNSEHRVCGDTERQSHSLLVIVSPINNVPTICHYMYIRRMRWFPFLSRLLSTPTCKNVLMVLMIIIFQPPLYDRNTQP